MSVNEAYEFTRQGQLSQVIERTTKKIPEPQNGQVVIAIRAVALNPVDEQLWVEQNRFVMKLLLQKG